MVTVLTPYQHIYTKKKAAEKDDVQDKQRVLYLPLSRPTPHTRMEWMG